MEIIQKLILTASITLSAFIGYPSSTNAANILLIESYHAGYAWQDQYAKALTEHLSDHTITTFEMDTKRLPADMHQQKADEAWAKYNEVKPDYVILGDDNALKYLGEKLAKTRTPTIFLGINNSPRNYFKNNRLPRNITGVIERPLFDYSISRIRTLLPNAKKILILFDNSITSQSAIKEDMINGTINRINVESRLFGTKAEWKNAVQSAKEEGFDAIIIGLYHTLKNENGEHVPAPDILNWTNKNTEVPLFAFWNFSVGKGKTVGGVVLDGYKIGEAAAKLTKEVITNNTIPRVRTNKGGTPTFSRSELKRWNITVPQELQKESIFFE